MRTMTQGYQNAKARMLGAGCTEEQAEAIANDLQLLVDAGTLEDTDGTWGAGAPMDDYDPAEDADSELGWEEGEQDEGWPFAW